MRLHSVQGKQLPGAFSLGAEVAQEGLLLACTYSDGLAAVTADTLTVWAVAGLQVGFACIRTRRARQAAARVCASRAAR